MGTITEKLTYLNTTKTMLRDSLNKFGSNILTTDTFRSYDTKLNEIYDKLPKVTQSGAGFTLSDVQNGQVDDFKMIGTDLVQNTTTGKNLFQSLITPSEFYKATYTKINDNSFSLNYTQSSTSNFSAFARIDLDISKLKPDTEYTISATNAVDGVTFSNIGALRTRINGVNGNVINSNILTFTTPNTIENVGIYFYIAYMNATTGTATITFNNIQVEEGSSVTSYEPYTNGASPNPNYPQEIKVVDGRQVITDKGKNLFDVNQIPHSNSLPGVGVITTINNDGTISTSGTNSATYRNIRYDIQLPAGEYIISGCPAGGSKNGYSSLVQLTEETSSQIFDTGSGATFTLTETTTVKFYPVRVGSETVNFNGLIFKPMIMLANLSDDIFEPYYNPVSYNIDLHGKNEFDGEYEDGYYNMNGTKPSTQDPYGRRSTNLNEIEPNTNYIISINNNIISETIRLFYYDASRKFISTESISNGTFTTPAECYYVSWHSSSLKQNYPDGIPNMMIEQGQTVTTYEDYYDYKLAKMPNTNYKNRIYKNNGNWCFEKSVEKVILDGSEEWGYGSISGVFYTTSITNYAISNNVPYSNYYTGVSNVSGASNMGQQSNNTIGFINVSGQTTPRFYIKDTKYTNNTPDLKTWLSTHNLELLYILANPVTTQITNTTLINQLEAISVHTGTNIIELSSDNNMTPQIEITRLKELERLT